MAPRNSNTPVAVTSSAGAGRLAGTIRIRSRRDPGWKCDTAVKTNMTTRAKRSAPLHESAWSHTPVNPIARATSQAVSMTISGAMRIEPNLKVFFELPQHDRHGGPRNDSFAKKWNLENELEPDGEHVAHAPRTERVPQLIGIDDAMDVGRNTEAPTDLCAVGKLHHDLVARQLTGITQ